MGYQFRQYYILYYWRLHTQVLISRDDWEAGSREYTGLPNAGTKHPIVVQRRQRKACYHHSSQKRLARDAMAMRLHACAA